ncbi:MAG: hypothetical protein KDC04_07960 [Saprospiraceae bacterium]|nr:hypothetical protein [Saprospiraceae bacterium]MCB9309295.1 hypothetical protein [Lewinellaceae bacterium]
MWKYLIVSLVYIGIIINISSCGITDNEAPIPGYIKVTSVGVEPFGNANEETHNITDLYVFLDGQIQGVFPLPAQIPIFEPTKNQELTILAGIKNNGVGANPVFYPFYKSIVRDIVLDPLETLELPLSFKYVDNAKLGYYDNFESINSIFTHVVGSVQGSIKRDNTTSTVGQYCGKITLDSGSPSLQLTPTNHIRESEIIGGSSYVEFDYKGDGVINVGVLKRNGTNEAVNYKVLVPCKSEWNKIYVEFTAELAAKDFDDYAIVLGFTRKESNNSATIYLDNFKHWHF